MSTVLWAVATSGIRNKSSHIFLMHRPDSYWERDLDPKLFYNSNDSQTMIHQRFLNLPLLFKNIILLYYYKIQVVAIAHVVFNLRPVIYWLFGVTKALEGVQYGL